MIINTVCGDPVIKFTTMTSAGKTVPAVVTNDRVEYGYVNRNMTDRKVEKKDIPSKIIFEDFVGFYGKEAYDKLKEIDFKFE